MARKLTLSNDQWIALKKSLEAHSERLFAKCRKILDMEKTFDNAANLRDAAQALTTTLLYLSDMPMNIRLSEEAPNVCYVDFKAIGMEPSGEEMAE